MTRYILIFAIILFSLCGCHQQQEEEIVSVPADTLPSLVTHIRQCSRIYTTEYKIHKIVTHDDVIRLKGTFLAQDFNLKMPLGDRKIAIPMDATLKTYIDMSNFSERNVEKTDGKIIIILPDPQVIMTSSKIDQKNIKEYIGLVRSHFTDAEMTNYERQGRAAIIESIPQLNILHTAQENAARVLVPLIKQMGYQEEDIIIQFRKEYGLRDLQSLIHLDIEHEKNQ
jgi:hypothetical protein